MPKANNPSTISSIVGVPKVKDFPDMTVRHEIKGVEYDVVYSAQNVIALTKANMLRTTLVDNGVPKDVVNDVIQSLRDNAIVDKGV